MKPSALLAPVAFALLAGQAACSQPAAAPGPPAQPEAPRQAMGPHFTDMMANPLTFVQKPGDVDAATVRLDTAAIAALKPDEASIIEVMVSYDTVPKGEWRAENGLEPRFEEIFASTGAHARLIATSFAEYQRLYWFAPDDDVKLVTALRAVPQPKDASIAVLRSNLDVLNAMRPDEKQGAAGASGTPR